MSIASGRSALLAVCVIVSLAALSIAACLKATELRLTIHTDLPCTDPARWKGVAVYVGVPGASLENKETALTTTLCDENGLVGTLVVTPSGSKDEEVGLRIVAGITTEPEKCAHSQYRGCIVTRRTIRFEPHDRVDLDIALAGSCVDLGCDSTSTCVNGSCKDSHLETPDADGGDGLTVRCGDTGIVCPTTGNVCCLTVDADAGTSTGECKPPEDCRFPAVVLNCDDEIDCTGWADDAGHPGMCLLSYTPLAGNNTFTASVVTNSQCLDYAGYEASFSGYGLDLCARRQPCYHGLRACVASSGGTAPNPLPGYFWCALDRMP